MNKRVIIAVALLLLLLPGIAVWWLTYTAAGLQFALNQLNRAPGITAIVRGVNGRLAGPLHIDYFELDHERVHIVARQIDIDLRPALLLTGSVSLNSFTAQSIDAALKRGKPHPDTGPPHFLPGFVRVSADQINIARARFVSYNGFTLEAMPLVAQTSVTRNQLQLRQLKVSTSWLDATGSFALRSATQLELAADVQAALKPGERAPLHTHVTMGGTAQRLNFVADVLQPSQAHVTAVLDLSRGWQLNAAATTQQWSLQPWLDKAPFSFKDAQLKVSMNDSGIHAVGDLTLPEWAPIPLHIDANGQYAARVITLREAVVSAKRGALIARTQGSIALREGTQPTLDLHATWRGLQWPLAAEAQRAYFLSANGAANLQGNSPYFFKVDADLTVPALARNAMTSAVANNTRVAAQGVLTPQVVLLDQYQWQVLGGVATGNGHLQFALPRAWSAAINANNLNTGWVHGALPGQVSFAAMATGQNFTAQAPLDVLLSNLTGTVRNQPLRASGRVTHARKIWRAENIGINWGSAVLRAAGSIGPQNNLRWTLRAPALQQLYPQLRGDISLSGQMHGEQDRPQLQLIGQSQHAAFSEWQSDGLTLNAQVDVTDRTPSNLSFTADRLSYGAYNLQHVQLRGNGQMSAHQVQFGTAVNVPQLDGSLQFNFDIDGAYVDKEWRATLKQLRVIDADNKSRVQLAHPTAFTVANSHAALQTLCLDIDSGKLCGAGEWREGDAWRVQASLAALPIDISNTAWAQDAHLHALIDARAAFQGSAAQAWSGSAQLQLSDAAIRYQLLSGKPQQLPINFGDAHIDADAQAIRAGVNIAIGDYTAAAVTAQAERANTDWRRWALSGHGALSSADAKLIPAFISEVDRAAGTVTADVSLAGTLGKPLFSGGMQLRNGELDLYRLNLALRALQLDTTLNDDRLQFTAQGNAGEGVLHASGDLNWRNADLYGRLQLKGDKLLVADLPEYHVLASPDLTFDIAKRNVDVKGDVLIPSARLQPKDISGAVQTSADARFKSDKVFERGSAWTINSSVSVRLGDDVQFDGLGLQGQLGGSVATQVRTANTPIGRGELNVNNGVYEAYGRKLDIKRGRLIYDDTALDNPGLDIQAERKINDITVGVYVRGLLRDPRLQFYSDPSMSQSQIVSYLIVGKPLDELQSGEATTVRSATNSLALQGGGYLAAQLGRRVGLEEVGVETGANNQQAFVLGKFLSPRLFVSYGISLTEAINTLKLRYTLSDHWTIKTEAGEARSADLEFRVDR